MYLQQLGRYTDLKTAVVLGGDRYETFVTCRLNTILFLLTEDITILSSTNRMDDQFAAIHENPDM